MLVKDKRYLVFVFLVDLQIVDVSSEVVYKSAVVELVDENVVVSGFQPSVDLLLGKDRFAGKDVDA